MIFATWPRVPARPSAGTAGAGAGRPGAAPAAPPPVDADLRRLAAGAGAALVAHGGDVDGLPRLQAVQVHAGVQLAQHPGGGVVVLAQLFAQRLVARAAELGVLVDVFGDLVERP